MDDLISRAEAIRVASGYCHWTNIPAELAKLPSVNPKPCEDAISRQAVLELAKWDGREGLGSIIHAFDVERLPPVTPTPKIGRWKIIKNTDGNLKTYVCSECGTLCGYKQKYCEECGAKMEVVE